MKVYNDTFGWSYTFSICEYRFDNLLSKAKSLEMIRISHIVTCLFLMVGHLVSAQNLSDTLEVNLLFDKGRPYLYTKTDSAIILFREALMKSERAKLKDRQAKALYLIGVGFHVKGELDSALNYYNKALPMLTHSKDSVSLSSVVNNLGLISLNRGDHPSAVKYLRRSATIEEKIGNIEGYASSLNNIGLIYQQVGDLENALIFFRKCEKIQSEQKNHFRLVQLYNNMGLVKERQNDSDSAFYYYKLSLQHAVGPESRNHMANPLVGIGKIFFQRNQLDSAKRYAEEAETVSSNAQQPKILSVAKLLLGNIELRLNRFSSSEELLTEGYELAKKHNLLPEIQQAALRFHQLYKQQGNFKKALEFFELYEETKTELLNEGKIREITRLEEQHKAEQEMQTLIAGQEAERLRIQKEKDEEQFEKKVFLLASTLLLVIAVIAMMSYRSNKKNSKKLASLNHELNLKNNKLNKLDADRTRFLANINHDFRTPLTLIKGHIGQILKDGDSYLTQKAESSLKMIENSSEQLNQMSEEIQNLLQIESKELQPQWQSVNISSFVSTVVDMFISSGGLREKQLIFHGLKEDIIVHIDLKLIQRVLGNLISNAIKFTDKKDQIIVSLDLQEKNLVIKVIDTGVGIATEDLPYVFDRFYQSSNNDFSQKEGFGIGLAMVKELTELHGGSVNVESEPGKGSAFTILLPFNLDKSVEQSGESPHPVHLDVDSNNPAPLFSSSPEGSKTVLIVEDHVSIRDYITGLLEGRYNTLQAANGKEALAVLEKQKVDLILTDLMMPWMDGFEFIELLQENQHFRDIPIMVVSARTSEADKMKVLGLGVNDFLSKPFDDSEFEKRIENLIRKRGGANSWGQISKNVELKSDIERDLLNKVNELVVSKLDDPTLNVEMLANVLCASVRKTNTMIKQLTGQPPKSYIKFIRLNYVHDLIVKKEITNATQAAKAIGMKNGTEFKQQYEKQFGAVPFKK